MTPEISDTEISHKDFRCDSDPFLHFELRPRDNDGKSLFSREGELNLIEMPEGTQFNYFIKRKNRSSDTSLESRICRHSSKHPSPFLR